jgi:hypothetical protein
MGLPAVYGVGDVSGVPSVALGVTVNVEVSEGAGDGEMVTVRVNVGVGVGWVPLEVIKEEIRPRLRQTIPARNINPLRDLARLGRDLSQRSHRPEAVSLREDDTHSAYFRLCASPARKRRDPHLNSVNHRFIPSLPRRRLPWLRGECFFRQSVAVATQSHSLCD